MGMAPIRAGCGGANPPGSNPSRVRLCPPRCSLVRPSVPRCGQESRVSVRARAVMRDVAVLNDGLATVA